MKTLVILSSILGDRSNSKQLADHLLARLKQSEPAGTVKIRDLAADPVPYFDGATVGALFTPAEARNAEQQRIAALSDDLVAELFDADRIVFAVPVYNFNLPAQFKSYIDHIARAGVTFRYTAEGKPEGLVQGKQVLVLIARGGKSEGTPDDTMTPYLKQMLAFLGMTDVTFIAAEGMAMGELAAQEGLALARQRIDALSLDARQGLAAA
ncbi:FMN-dependent NADH-azoreductase [Bordetella bronchiseptica]|uniref:FMN-dependent NADH-azoreductase n=1 Tax=Bordetella bronchiseptica TaxID=518 RepID=UPI0004A1898A|nr:NAD(P)H-dependent oxidoreductase [Bordetella bronchiseptica]KDD84928.1 flavin reductase [Bordetella bronchiseptica MO275]QIY00142.1 FMN-dependent NADH-azoreductase [Bordetella bronchiseptica]RSB98629.1 FMN-dependent NADH-azoreductase [Bordetella bronchiseptica]RSC07693.1 FMN-dependent NADH-azoreductase [Bordetella bronchiseptica]